MTVLRRLLAAFALLALLAAGACGKAPREPEDSDEVEEAIEKPNEDVAGPSIYEVPMRLTAQDGRAVGLDLHRGHPVIISMFYASCPGACPMLIADVKRLVSSLGPEAREDVRVLLVSLDPANDTAEALAALAATREIDLSRWTLARASEEDVRTLAAVLGVKYRFLPDGAINHSSIITILGRDGQIVHAIDGLQSDVAPAAEKLEAMSRH